MGLMNKVRGALGGGDDTVDDAIEEEFGADEVEFVDEDEFEDGEEFDDEVEEEPEGEEMVWDSAYDFADWYLEEYGFASLRGFGEKAIMWRLSRAPEYRDRIESGLNTLNSVRQAKEDLERVKGESEDDRNYQEMANKLEAGNKMIGNLRELSGEDEVIIQQGMSLAREAIGAIGQRVSEGDSDVDLEMGESDREI